MAAAPVLPKLVGQRVKRREDPASDPGPRHLRRRREDRRHAAPRVQAQRRRARPDPVHRHPRRRGDGRGGGGLHRGADRRVSRADADRHAVPVARTPRGGGGHRPLRRRSRSRLSWPATATSRGDAADAIEVDCEPLPAVVDPEAATTRPVRGAARRHPEQRRPRPGCRQAPGSAARGRSTTPPSTRPSRRRTW